MPLPSRKMKSIAPPRMHGSLREVYRFYQEASFRLWKLRLRERPVQREPIFMIGSPRGGTSISVQLFGSHPWVANWSEAIEVWDPKGHLDPEADHEWRATDVREQDAERLHAWFEWYRQNQRKRRFINKHPRSSVRVDYIKTIFPDAFFIHVVRDGRAVASSILNKIRNEPLRQRIPFGNFCKPPNWRDYLNLSPIEQAGIQWREIVSYVRGRRNEMGGRYFEYRYEDMCADARGLFSRLYEFVGLPVDEASLHEIPEKMQNMNEKNISMLSRPDLETLNAIQGKLLGELGYKV